MVFGKENYMKWNELSNDAKNIIEWVEDPYTNKRKIIEIKIGDYFEPETAYRRYFKWKL